MDTLFSVLGQHLHRYLLPLGEEGRKSATDSTTTGRIKSNSPSINTFRFPISFTSWWKYCAAGMQWSNKKNWNWGKTDWNVFYWETQRTYWSKRCECQQELAKCLASFSHLRILTNKALTKIKEIVWICSFKKMTIQDLFNMSFSELSWSWEQGWYQELGKHKNTKVREKLTKKRVKN